jgi:hypothetical protein
MATVGMLVPAAATKVPVTSQKLQSLAPLDALSALRTAAADLLQKNEIQALLPTRAHNRMNIVPHICLILRKETILAQTLRC